MRTVILGEPPPALASLIADRQRLGLDRHDELWEGDYHMAPAANVGHGDVMGQIYSMFRPLALERGLWVSQEFNLGDTTNFRVPDLGVHRGRQYETWLPTAAIVIEVRSPDDESYEKFPFYFDRGVDEVLIVDLTSHEVTWLRRGAHGFEPCDSSTLLGVTAHDLASTLDW